MISVSFFLHPNRQDNLKTIHNAYKDYDIIDEVLVVTGKEVDTEWCDPKFKFVHMPGPYTYGEWPSFGLLSRYTFALCCKNRFVFMQDDDCYFNEETFKKLAKLQQPLAGTKPTPRWFRNNEYISKSPTKNKNSAEILITRGILIDISYLPDVIKYAKMFWKGKYQNCFNGEDIFLSMAMQYLTEYNEFSIVTDEFFELPKYDVQLDQKINKKGSRTKITRDIYNFFAEIL